MFKNLKITTGSGLFTKEQLFHFTQQMGKLPQFAFASDNVYDEDVEIFEVLTGYNFPYGSHSAEDVKMARFAVNYLQKALLDSKVVSAPPEYQLTILPILSDRLKKLPFRYLDLSVEQQTELAIVIENRFDEFLKENQAYREPFEDNFEVED